MSKVKIVTDSACDLSLVDRRRFDIAVVPLSIRFGDEEFVDGVDLTNDDFWIKANASSTLPSTAAPSPGAFAEAFRQAVSDGYTSVVCITLASGLSATYQSAVAGKSLVEGDIEVYVIDSLTCTVAQAQICLMAAQFASSNDRGAEVHAYVNEQVQRQQLFGALDTLDNLKKGGRIGAANAFFGALLAVKPIITIVNGEVKPLSKQRTRSKALRHLADLVIAEGPVSNVGISHSGAPDVDTFVDLLAPIAKRDEILITQMGPTIGVHGGPRLIAVTFSKD